MVRHYTVQIIISRARLLGLGDVVYALGESRARRGKSGDRSGSLALSKKRESDLLDPREKDRRDSFGEQILTMTT